MMRPGRLRLGSGKFVKEAHVPALTGTPYRRNLIPRHRGQAQTPLAGRAQNCVICPRPPARHAQLSPARFGSRLAGSVTLRDWSQTAISADLYAEPAGRQGDPRGTDWTLCGLR